MKKIIIILFSFLMLVSCSTNPYAPSNKLYKKQAKELARIISRPTLYPVETAGLKAAPYFVGTTNFNLRKPNYVVIHYTAQDSCGQTLKTFTLTQTQVSAHYVICEDGTIYHMLNDYLRAWHAGESKWGNLTDINSSSIGIEIDNNGSELFSEVQIKSLLFLLERLKQDYSIPAANFIGHSDIAPTRKSDPGIYFPWKRLADAGFGLWPDKNLEIPPSGFDYLMGLRLIGYNLQDTTAAIKSFKRHFIQSRINAEIDDFEKKVIYNLSTKY